MTATPRVPVFIRYRADSRVFSSQTGQGRVDGLLFGTDQTYLDFTIMEGKDLWTEHGCISDSNQLEQPVIIIIPGNNKKPGSVRGTVNMH